MQEHPLAVWLKKRGKTQEGFAAEIDYAPSYVSQIISGTIWPSRKAAETIARATGGEITANSFLPPGTPLKSDAA